MQHVSFSALQTYSRCQEQFRRKYIERDRRETSLPAVLGTAFHEAVEDYENANLDPDALIPLARGKLRSVENLRDLTYYGKQDADWAFTDGIPMLAANYLTVRERDNAVGHRLIDSELDVEQNIDTDYGTVTVKGYIDQVLRTADGDTFVRDIKTGKQKDDHAVQLAAYAYLYEMMTGTTVKFGQGVYVKDQPRKKGPQYKVSMPLLGKGYLTLILGDLMQAAEGDVFIPTGGFTDACGMCEFQNECKMGVQLMGLNAVVEK